jgi:DNA-directed RNA polymerase specialized sigma subunit
VPGDDERDFLAYASNRQEALRRTAYLLCRDAHHADDLVRVRQALSRLTPRQRAVLVLRFYQDLPVEQAAEAMGCSTGTVKSQTSRALTALRRVLEGAGVAAAPLLDEELTS